MPRSDQEWHSILWARITDLRGKTPNPSSTIQSPSLGMIHGSSEEVFSAGVVSSYLSCHKDNLKQKRIRANMQRELVPKQGDGGSVSTLKTTFEHLNQ